PAARRGRGEAAGAGPLGGRAAADGDDHLVTPSSTYRIQFSSATTLQQGAELVPYLDALGAGAVYASPLLESGAGSNHGYDVGDPTRISAERRGPGGLRAVRAAGRA